MLKTIALFGGTFDPIHRGHVQSAVELKQKLQLDELRLLPCHNPPHRKTPNCSSAQRLEMVRLAVQGTGLLVDDRELKRDQLSYSVDTLEQLRRECGDQISLMWVMGTDAFSQLDGWYRWQDLMSLAHIVVMARPQEQLPETGPVAELLARHAAASISDIKHNVAGKILTVALQPYPISASGIRSAIAADEPVEQFLPSAVLNYIKEHHLYGGAID